MSKRNPGNIFQKAPSKKDVEAIIKKRKEEEIKLIAIKGDQEFVAKKD